MITDRLGIGMTSQRARDRLIAQLQNMGIRSAEVLELIGNVPRHLFVDEALASRAYENTALPICHGQTISQPYIVARMTEALIEGGPLRRVLEIGGGCGYQTAILARLAEQVYCIERIDALAIRLRERMRSLRCLNIHVRHGDGSNGWPRHAPYDGILVAAAPREVPLALREQLALGGRLVIPYGEPGDQKLIVVLRNESGFEERFLDAVSFVPLVAGAA